MPSWFRPGPEHRRIVVLSGAGLSARTGLGTFRGPQGMWALEPELEVAMQASALPGSIPALWTVWGSLAQIAAQHGPAPGHYAIARLGARVITQNVDGLHQAAGSEDVVELHGSARRAVCLGTACHWSHSLDLGVSADAPRSAGDSGPGPEDLGIPATCPVCGEPTRPDVVLFDELLPADALDRSVALVRDADLFVAVGTSGVVHPAAQLAPLARSAGAMTVLIDVDPPLGAQFGSSFDEVIRGDAHEVLPDWERHRSGFGGHPFLEPFGA